VGTAILGNLPFQQGRITVHSVVLKQINTSGNQITQNSITIELFDDGRARFFIPLRRDNVTDGRTVSREVKSSQVRSVLEEHLRQDTDLDVAIFFNLTMLWQAVLTLTNFYLDWLKDDMSLIHDFRVIIRGNGLWRTIAFVDHDRWAEYVRTFHLPLMANDEVKVPEERREGVDIDIDESPASLWGALITIIGMMFGFPTETLRDLIATFKSDTIDGHNPTT
jgi:hypothetical protein